MAHSVKIYDTCIGCIQCVRAISPIFTDHVYIAVSDARLSHEEKNIKYDSMFV